MRLSPLRQERNRSFNKVLMIQSETSIFLPIADMGQVPK